MKALFTALLVAIVFAVFFVLFLIVPLIVIGVGYFWMVWAHNRKSKKAKAKNDEGDGGGDPAVTDDPDAPAGAAPAEDPATQREPGREVEPVKQPLVGSTNA